MFFFIALTIDQTIKVAVDSYMPLHEPIHILPFLALYRTYNTGIAFSMLMDIQPWFIIGMRLGIISCIFFIWKHTTSNRRFLHTGYTLIFTGALGNLIDQFLYGHVIDYVMIYTQTWSFAVFNLADAMITLGACTIALDEIIIIYNKMRP